MKKICKNCGKQYERKNARKYCEKCSYLVKKKLHRNQNKEYDKRHGSKLKREKYYAQKDRGRDINTESYCTHFEDEKKYMHGIRIVLPFDRKLSKNKVFITKQGHIVRWKETNDARKDLVWEIKGIRHVFFQAKIWLDVTVFQPDHMGDALNYIDNIADAIQEAIGINDRWYAISNLNWHIDKNNPRIQIKIKQTAREHHAICKFCGRETPFSYFPETVRKNLENQFKNGGKVNRRICNDCVKPVKESSPASRFSKGGRSADEDENITNKNNYDAETQK